MAVTDRITASNEMECKSEFFESLIGFIQSKQTGTRLVFSKITREGQFYP